MLDPRNWGAPRSSDDLLAFDEFFLFGATPAADEVIRFLAKRGKKVVGFFDNSLEKHGLEFRGARIHAPADAAQLLAEGKRAIIVAAAYQTEIHAQLTEDLGISDAVVFPYVSEMFHGHFGEAAVAPHLAEIEALMASVADQESRDYIEALMAFRWTMNAKHLKRNPRLVGFYHYDGPVGPHAGDEIVDCGAYTGDTAKAFLDRLGGEAHVIAIEPVSANYAAMNKWIADENMAAKVEPINMAVGAGQGTARIALEEEAEDPRASLETRINGSAFEEVKVDSLDHMLNGRAADIDYLKMDLEGFEIEAINGARALIGETKPDLAIAGYHVPDHLWRIPALIREIAPDYRIYVGHHPAAPYECEFFATAKAPAQPAE